MIKELEETYDQLKDWQQKQIPSICITVIDTWRSAPRKVGAMMAVNANLEFIGSLSGGCVESDVVAHCENLFKSNTQKKIISYQVENEEAWAVGLSCGGHMKVLMEKTSTGFLENMHSVIQNLQHNQACMWQRALAAGLAETVNVTSPQDSIKDKKHLSGQYFSHYYQPAIQLLIVGAGHLSQSVAKAAQFLDFKITVIDPRPAFAVSKHFPEGVQIVNKAIGPALSKLALSKNTAILCLSHQEKLDDPACQIACEKKVGYIGALGSIRSHQKRVARLQALGCQPEALAQIKGPVGLDIAAQTPAEIAIAILAEIIKVFRNRL